MCSWFEPTYDGRYLKISFALYIARMKISHYRFFITMLANTIPSSMFTSQVHRQVRMALKWRRDFERFKCSRVAVQLQFGREKKKPLYFSNITDLSFRWSTSNEREWKKSCMCCVLLCNRWLAQKYKNHTIQWFLVNHQYWIWLLFTFDCVRVEWYLHSVRCPWEN